METLESNPGGNGEFGPVKAVPRQPSRAPRKPRQTGAIERRAIYALAAASAVVAVFSASAPASFGPANVVLRAGFAGLVTLCASRSRRWTWLVLAGVAVLGAEGVWLAVAGLSLLGALAAALLPRKRIYGAVIGAVAVQPLLRIPDLGWPLASTLVAAAAVAPVLVSAYAVSPRRVRKKVHRVLVASAVVFVCAVALFGASAALAYSSVERGAEDARDGLDAARQGKTGRAAELFDSSARQFGSANSTLTAWWTAPTLAVPIVSQHADALRESTAQGQAVASASARLAREVDYETLRYQGGKIDVGRIRAAQAPLADTAATLATAVDGVDRVQSPWLVPLVADQIDTFDRDLRKASDEADIALATAKVAPGLLGGDGPRRYFVAVITPAEQRGLGGFMGNWLEITAVDGKLEIARSGRARELNQFAGGNDRNTITADADYASRYAQFRPGNFFQDITLSPDLPTITKVVNELYPKAGGGQIDGMLTVDPTGLAALLELTGPVSVPGLDVPLSSANAVEWLTKRQYTDLPNRDVREDLLDDAGRATFDKLVSGDLPGPRRLADVLSPVVDDHRIMFTSLHGDEQQLMEQVEVSGALPRVTDRDFFSVRSQDRTNSKIDIFLERKIDYKVRVDPDNGTIDAKAVITLKNGAPAQGLPDSIIGSNDQGFEKGTNKMTLSFYTPHRLKEAKIDGTASGLGFQKELGYSVYSAPVSIPAGGTVVVELDLTGKLANTSTYELVVSPQPMVIPDRFVATVTTTVDHRLSPSGGRSPGFAVQTGATEAVLATTEQDTFTASVGIVSR